MANLKLWIKDFLLTKNNGLNSHLINKNFLSKNKDLIDKIEKINKPLPESLYLIFNDIQDIPKCPICNSNLKFKNFIKGYTKFCSSSCAHKSQETQNKIKETKIFNFGENYKQIIFNKVKETNLKRYSNEYYTKTQEYKQKTRETCIKKYNVDHHTKSEEIKQKTKQTCIKKYGFPNVSQSEIIKKKIKETNMKRYNAICTLNNLKIKENYQQKNILKYRN